MTTGNIIAWVSAAVLLLVLAGAYVAFRMGGDPAGDIPFRNRLPGTPQSPETHPQSADHQGFIHGRVATRGGAVHEGRLRWGGDQEAFWGDYFNGRKVENPWIVYVPPEEIPREKIPVEVFGVTITHRDRQIDLQRFFMARFGDIVRIEPSGVEVKVTLKSGTVFRLDRLEAGDFDDGVQVRAGHGEAVLLDSLQIAAIELFPAPLQGAAPYRLYGTVRTGQGDFTGFVQWDRTKGIGSDVFRGRSDQGETGIPFDTIRSIVPDPRNGTRVTLLDGREAVLSGSRDTGRDHRGIYVDDRRYGRVLVSWEAFQGVDFSPGGSGPGYDHYPAGLPLRGRVTTRAGLQLEGRLVYDLDESETTETLDAPDRGVDYTIPFGLIVSIVPGDPGAVVTLHGGESLQLEAAGDLGPGNAGMLVFVDGRPRPEYVPWSDILQIEFVVERAGGSPSTATVRSGYHRTRLTGVYHADPVLD